MSKLLSKISKRGGCGVYPHPGGEVCLFIGMLFVLLLPFTSHSQNIVISEIMYNPVPGVDPVLGGTNRVDGDEFEFLELYNAGSVDCDLTGWSVNEGVTFHFTETTILGPGAVSYTHLTLPTNREV